MSNDRTARLRGRSVMQEGTSQDATIVTLVGTCVFQTQLPACGLWDYGTMGVDGFQDAPEESTAYRGKYGRG
jgi:hypothetical protein